MSALADEPNHFLSFCRNIDPSLSATSFVSRGLYGQYLRETFELCQSAHPARIQTVINEVTAITHEDINGGWKIHFEDGRYLTADHCVLATGNEGVRKPSILSQVDPNNVIDPWDYNAMRELPTDKAVTLLGSGLTAIDTTLFLTQGNSRRSVQLVSRHGLLPRPHRVFPTAPKYREFPEYFSNIPITLRARFREFRNQLKYRLANGEDWRDVLNELRAHTPRLWGELSQIERARFLRHLQPLWDVHRHRLPPIPAHRFNWLITQGQVRVIAGRLVTVQNSDSGIEVCVRHRGENKIESLWSSALINCTGIDSNVKTTPSRLLRQLVHAGLIQPDVHRLGISVGAHNQVLDGWNQPVPGLWYIGPFLKAKFWEATAVPELREHALRLAARLTQADF